MTSVVHVKHHSIALVEVLLDGCKVLKLALEGVPEGFDGSPDEVVAVYISSEGAKPDVEVLRGDVLSVDLPPTVVEDHGG